MGLLFWMLGFAYLLAVIPAWLTAGMDLALSAKPYYLRFVATMAVAAIMAELVAFPRSARGSPHHWPYRRNSSRGVLVALE